MALQLHPTEPLDFATGVAPQRARAIAAALGRHVLPLLALRDGRAEPLASAALYHWQGRQALLTCRHLFDTGVALGDLAVPLAAGTRLSLAALRPRLVEHPDHDVAAIALAPGRALDLLLRHWPAVPLAGADDGPPCAADLFVVAGYPYAQMRRHDGLLHARPLVFFSRGAAPAETLLGQPRERPESLPRTRSGAAPSGAPDSVGTAGSLGADHRHTADLLARSARLHYARLAQRVDGATVHAPALDGVSGATVWAVREAAAGCVLHPVGVQCAFKHDAYVRGEPFAAARELLHRLSAP